jgi:hypothetical protein
MRKSELSGNSGGLKVEFEIHKGGIPLDGFVAFAYYLLFVEDPRAALATNVRGVKLDVKLTTEGAVIVHADTHLKGQTLSHYTHWAIVPHWSKITGVKTYEDEIS